MAKRRKRRETPPRAEQLGDAPEERMENFPRGGIPERQLQEQPGAPKPAETDAVGEGAVEELSQEFGDRDMREREEETQRDNIRAVYAEPATDAKRRAREMGAPWTRKRARRRRR